MCDKKIVTVIVSNSSSECHKDIPLLLKTEAALCGYICDVPYCNIWKHWTHTCPFAGLCSISPLSGPTLNQHARLQEHCCRQQTQKPIHRSTKQYHTIQHTETEYCGTCLNKSQEIPPYFYTFTVHFINISCEGFVESGGSERREKTFQFHFHLK